MPAVVQMVMAGLGGSDTTAPTITSASSTSVAENATLSHSLTANESVTWSIVSGADQTQFEISGSTLRWSSNGTRDYESPADANTDNAYIVTVRATDLSSNTTDQTITVTVTDVNTVSFVAASGVTYTTATSQNQTIPASSATGDLLIAVIMHRDTLTPPAGWTSVASASCTNGTAQQTSVYKRTAIGGDPGASTTWSQATSQRMAVHIMAFRKDAGCDVVDSDTATQSNDTTSSNVGDMAVSTATANNQMGVACGSTVLANGVGTDSMAASAGWTLTSGSPTTGNRLGVAYRSRNNTETTAGTFTTDTSPTSNNGWACVSLVIG